MTIGKIFKEKQCIIVYLRTTKEFRGENDEGSMNIPLQENEKRIEGLKSHKQTLIVYSNSGGSSGQATHYLTHQGIETYNAVSWLDVTYYQSQTI